MNILQGTIDSLRVNGNLSLVSIQVGNVLMKSIVIETPATCSYLVKGKSVNVLFKETEVVIGKGNNLAISLQNRLTCTIKHIEKGVLLTKLTLATQNTEIFSIITTDAVTQLDLKVGEQVVAMVKTNEVMLSE